MIERGWWTAKRHHRDAGRAPGRAPGSVKTLWSDLSKAKKSSNPAENTARCTGGWSD